MPATVPTDDPHAVGGVEYTDDRSSALLAHLEGLALNHPAELRAWLSSHVTAMTPLEYPEAPCGDAPQGMMLSLAVDGRAHTIVNRDMPGFMGV